MDVTIEIVGWVGTGLLVVAFALVSAKGRSPGIRYQLLNAVGSCALVINGAAHGAWPSVGLNLVWLGIAVVSIVGIFFRKGEEITNGK